MADNNSDNERQEQDTEGDKELDDAVLWLKEIEFDLASLGDLQRSWAPPSPRNNLDVGVKFSMTYCTLHLNQALSLEMVASSLGKAVYNRAIDVVQKRLKDSQIVWIWADGTLMIVNGSSRAMLAETQAALMLNISGEVNFQAGPANNLQTSRHISWVEFPWQINLDFFCETHSPSPRLVLNEMKYVHFVDKELPGVAARVYGSGVVDVYAMSTEKTDQMLAKLYPIAANFKRD